MFTLNKLWGWGRGGPVRGYIMKLFAASSNVVKRTQDSNMFSKSNQVMFEFIHKMNLDCQFNEGNELSSIVVLLWLGWM